MRRSEGNGTPDDNSQVDVNSEEEEKDDSIGNDDWQ